MGTKIRPSISRLPLRLRRSRGEVMASFFYHIPFRRGRRKGVEGELLF